MYVIGVGTPKDPAQADVYFSKACTVLGDVSACKRYGIPEKDWGGGAQQQAAQQQQDAKEAAVKAQKIEGERQECTADTSAIPLESVAAPNLSKKSQAEQKVAEGCGNLAEDGDSAAKKMAFDVLTRRCDDKDGPACDMLGKFYSYNMYGLPTNKATARGFYSKACKVSREDYRGYACADLKLYK